MMRFWSDRCGSVIVGGDVGDISSDCTGSRDCGSCDKCGRAKDSGDRSDCGCGERALCGTCGFFVVVKNHADRCRVREELSDKAKDERARLELWGDAVHRCDVVGIVAGIQAVSQYSVRVAEYVGNGAQRRYLEMIGDVLDDGHSDHSWGSYFERRYVDVEFRKKYLAWLWEDCGADFEDVEPVQSLAELQYDGGWASVNLRVFPFDGI
jgi:hypothetical protein